MEAVHALIENVAGTGAPILLRGEPGAGKDFLARRIHAAGPGRRGPFIKVNTRSIPPALLESELFGHEKGAFAGAHRRKPGRFEYATGGTLYLDEITDLPVPLQAGLLQSLRKLTFRRIGGHEVLVIDTRVIAATTRDVERAVAEGTFREDLYDLLSAVTIRIPPLRERPC
jgi:DNA-binding NtrC family response regulator